jgi:hypothetical protein
MRGMVSHSNSESATYSALWEENAIMVCNLEHLWEENAIMVCNLEHHTKDSWHAG